MNLTKISLALAAALSLAACQTAPQPEQPFYTLVDLSDDFVAFYDRTIDMAPAARAAAFRAELNAKMPGFYDPARFDTATPEQYDARIIRAFEDFPALRERYLATTASFESAMAPARESFLATFPDASPVGDIYFVHSLGEMDGGTREIDGRVYLIFGADVMARVHEPGQTTPFFHHELFHFYHEPYFHGCSAFWCALWGEGLATYVAQELNPGASDHALLLNIPRPIRPEVDANLAYAVCETRARLDSESQDDYRAFFMGAGALERLPPRAGYYIGLLVAQEVGRTHTLQQLAHLSPAEARPLVEAALGALATCPPAAN
ncbi:MAG: hypothetical protein R3C16_02245 [Hyphomonadaceae bacterium]